MVDNSSHRPAGLSVRQRLAAGSITLVATGEVDFNTHRALMTAIEHAVGGNCALVVVDLSEVWFVDSSGIRTLVKGHELAVAAGVAYRVVGAHGMVERVLKIVGVLDLLTGHAN